MKLKIKWKQPGCADCEAQICAKGFLIAMIYWGTKAGPLEGWSSLASVPLNPSGKGTFTFDGFRAVPIEATHLCARCITPDFSVVEDIYEEIPEENRFVSEAGLLVTAVSVMSDLHVSGKTGKLSRALSMAENDIILLAGDLTNDGLTGQFKLFQKCIEKHIPEKLVFSVTGNHDQLYDFTVLEEKPYEGYSVFQEFLLKRAEEKGFAVEREDSGAYAVQLGGVKIIGLQCVAESRRFVFGNQLKWLEQQLKDYDGWHIILCHAPLLLHNPMRNNGMPYLSRNDELQNILDRHKKIIFISGHTHISPNMRSCVEFLPEKQTLYINSGSVTPTELYGEILMPADWKDGVITELLLYENRVEITTKSAYTGICYPRGYYRFHKFSAYVAKLWS